MVVPNTYMLLGAVLAPTHLAFEICSLDVDGAHYGWPDRLPLSSLLTGKDR